jgi:acetylornithine deacetylase/succinyl-diaminopimelate desuccinylase-like protein
VLFGAGGAGAHATEEWVSISQLASTTRILVAVAHELCGP